MQEWIERTVESIEEITLSFDGVKKYYNSKHITFKFENQALFYIKIDKNQITLGCHKGYMLEDRFSFDYASKYMRHRYINTQNDFDKKFIREYVEGAIGCSIELNEKNRIRASLRRRNQ